MSRHGTSSKYREGEVRNLITEYAAHRARADTTRRGLHSVVALADLDRALAQLAHPQYEAVLLVGLLGYPQREAAVLLKTSDRAVGKRYVQGLEDVFFYINGGE